MGSPCIVHPARLPVSNPGLTSAGVGRAVGGINVMRSVVVTVLIIVTEEMSISIKVDV